jgi:hypothetical protein
VDYLLIDYLFQKDGVFSTIDEALQDLREVPVVLEHLLEARLRFKRFADCKHMLLLLVLDHA